MPAQHHGLEVDSGSWFQPILLPVEAYGLFVQRLNTALRELEAEHETKPDYAADRITFVPRRRF